MIYKRAETYLHITPEQLARCMPGCPDPESWARAFDDGIDRWRIGDVAMLMAQVGHESSDLNRLEESLWYSADRLMVVWPSRFKTYARASQYARNPEALANEVYSGRMGNIEPGDGWRFRGQGPIQLTGRDNYESFASAIGDDAPLKDPSLLTKPTYGALSACWYYAARVTPGADIETVTREINGGLHGLGDRKKRYERCLSAIFS